MTDTSPPQKVTDAGREELARAIYDVCRSMEHETPHARVHALAVEIPHLIEQAYPELNDRPSFLLDDDDDDEGAPDFTSDPDDPTHPGWEP